MKTLQRLTILYKNKRLAVATAFLFVGAFAAIGIYLLSNSRAASPYVSREAETGSLSGGATTQSDTLASGGQYVKLGQPNTAVTYYVDCLGNDNNNGLSPSSSWKTLAKANQAVLKPGESLVLKRGCIWNEQLAAKWTGTSSSPITISAYGVGNNPLIQISAQNSLTNIIDVDITGSYQIIENISTTVIDPSLDSSCIQTDHTAMPHGFYADFKLNTTSSYNTLSNLDISSASVGISMSDTTNNNKILNNHIHDLHYLWRLEKDPGGALGSIGVNLDGNNNELAHNLFERNLGYCTYSDGTVSSYSAPFEVFNANRNYVHHNQAYGHRKHFEMGHDSTHTTDDNVLAYNLFVSNADNARGPNIHGSGNSFGPVNRTQIYYNTIVFTGIGSEGISCDCTGGATIKDNIFVAEAKSAYYKGTLTEGNNIYWDYKLSSDPTTPSPFVQFASPVSQTTISSTSKMADPLFVNPSTDWHLLSSSPAVSGGQTISTTDPLLTTVLSQDLDGKGTLKNIGAYVYP